MSDQGLDTEETKMNDVHSLRLRISFLGEGHSCKHKDNMEGQVL